MSDSIDFSKAPTYFDSFEVDEKVVSAARRCDKAKAFLVVKPLDYSLLSIAHNRNLEGEGIAL